ncbi:putative sulfate exporter family transporter [Loktanella sp. D2R18]|uniref:YeiH family protein n=1 Tax=Rhodobacterales TaxID=204455 RepID=UPI000DE940BB|nr:MULTISPECIES: putative sulfate exporter family transporter [Rhodobacterales]MDO6591176.1 putative sulfate exporter family transporter [Yoonia sp. 1_MG-2023]RBW41440.1 putative sulfate exporter family transporter [Loktanella sp. D2R18]
MVLNARAVFPGLLFAAMVAMAAQFLSEHYGAPVMLMAILLGIPFQFLSTEERTSVGIAFASRRVLRIGVALLGVRVSVDMVAEIGFANVALVASGVALTILLGLVLAPLFGRSRSFGFLVGGSVAICGASAAMAIASLLPKGENTERDVTFTVVSVTLASTVAMIAYPILISAMGMDSQSAGVFLGGTIHDVAQVVGAGYSVSEETGDISTLVKLFRVGMLAPVVFIGALFLRQSGQGAEGVPLVPGFVIGFLALAAMNSFGWLPDFAIQTADTVSRACLVTAVAAVGMKTSFEDLRSVGRSAPLMILILTVALAGYVLIGQHTLL